ncbi:hypothetical protein C8Q80DRAFT_1106518, partial [Daedaleopsis nitida]
CLVPASSICCSLCSPNHRILPPLSATPIKERTTWASKVTNMYTMTSIDNKFHAALHAYHREKTQQIYGWRHLKKLSPSAVLSDEQLKRILNCAHAHKLASVDDLVKGTKWSRARKFGEDVLCLISQYVFCYTILAIPFADLSQTLSGTSCTREK